jgi:hypothetical protein
MPGGLENEVADFAVLDALSQLLERPAVTGHQSHADFEVLGRGLFAELDHPPAGRAIHGDRFLHEDVQALLDGVSEMHPAERRWRCKDSDIARTQTIHRLLVGVEAHELAIFWHIHPVPVPIVKQVLVAAGQPTLEDIGHGDELDRAVLDGHSVARRTGAPAAAADQGELDGIALPRVDTRNHPCGQGRRCRDPTGVLQELTTRCAFVGNVAHNGFPPN